MCSRSQCGGSEDEAISAFLHDALEDQYRENLPAEMQEDFGSVVPRVGGDDVLPAAF